MKKIFFLLTLVFSSGAWAQVFKTSLTAQGWAGGMCCATGVNYTLTITGNVAELEKLAVVAVCVDKHYFENFNVSSVKTASGSSYRIYSFSYSINPYSPADTEQNPKSCDNNRIYLEENKFLTIESRSDLPFLAYP
jgi:hypothetical protein